MRLRNGDMMAPLTAGDGGAAQPAPPQAQPVARALVEGHEALTRPTPSESSSGGADAPSAVEKSSARAAENVALLPHHGFDGVADGAQAPHAPRGAARRCCASHAPGWRTAVVAASWFLLVLGAWLGVVVATPRAAVLAEAAAADVALMQKGSQVRVRVGATGADDLCDPLEIQACAGAQPWWAAAIICQARVDAFARKFFVLWCSSLQPELCSCQAGVER